ncbi:ATP-binding protein [Chloroflexota bacterium]
MAILKKAPEDIKQCALYKQLETISNSDDGCEEKTAAFISTVAPLCELTISGPFKEYTLHDKNHSKKLVHLVEYVLTPETLQHLSPLECLLIIYSAFLHDLGMALSSKDRANIITQEDFIDNFREWSYLWETLQQFRSRLSELSAQTIIDKSVEAEKLSIETEIFQLQEAALSNYLRPRHATRETYRRVIDNIKAASKRPDLFEINGVSIEDWLIEINISHNLDAGVLAEIRGPYDERFPRELSISGYRLNTQFVGAILRLVDILDFDRERTPYILFESLGILSRSIPGSEVTLHEWQKNMSVHSTEINNEEIVISADCEHPVIEKTIRDFCKLLEREIRDTLVILRYNNKEITEAYQFSLPVSVVPRIKSNKYTYKDISFQLNQTAISSLLMGDRLYSNQAATIRELIQNAIDACSARENILRDAKYKPEVSVSHFEDESHRHWIEVSDNGIGMDEHTICEYFLQIGNSYYRTPEFERLYLKSGALKKFAPVSKFGIGLASVFMISDALEAYTRCVCSGRQDDTSRLVRIERMGGLAFISEIPETSFGTKIRIRLRPNISVTYDAFSIESLNYLKTVILHPAFDIHINLTNEPITIRSGYTISLLSTAGDYFKSQRIEPIIVDFERWSETLKGKAILFFHIDDDGKLSHRTPSKRLVIDLSGRRGGIDPNKFLENYRGNLVSVNGFKMTLKRQSKLFKIGREGIALLLDIEVIGDSKVEYDVPRERIIGIGANYLRNSIFTAILRCLNETNAIDRFSDLTKEHLGILTGEIEAKATNPRNYYKGDLTAELLEKVVDLLPKTQWPKSIHKIIANKLNISNGRAWRAVDTLLESSTITKPE